MNLEPSIAPERRIVIVTNPHSTGASSIKREVLDVLDQQAINYTHVTTKYPDFNANTQDLASQLRNGDRIINAGGDGVASQLSNAILLSGIDAELGFLPFGNFNDIARTYSKRGSTVLDLLAADTIKAVPLSIEVNGEHWRHELAYLTLGWTAIAANEFGSTDSREDLRRAPNTMRLGKSLAQLAFNYFRNRNTYLPIFQTSQTPDKKLLATDILAINNPRVGSIVRSNQNFYDSPLFGYKEVNIAHIVPNVIFGLKALASHAPLDEIKNILITFDTPQAIPLQNSGEFSQLKIDQLAIYKDSANTLKIIHSA